MGLTVCPAAVVAAPVESVWELLSAPALRDDLKGVRPINFMEMRQCPMHRCRSFGLREMWID